MSIQPIAGMPAATLPASGASAASSAGSNGGSFAAQLAHFEQLHDPTAVAPEPAAEPVRLAEPPEVLDLALDRASEAWASDAMAAALDQSEWSLQEMLLFQHDMHAHMLQLEVATKAATEGGSGMRQLFQQQA